MNDKRTNLRIPSESVAFVRTGLTVLFTAFLCMGSHAQTSESGVGQPPRDQNSELRTRTWSIYAQGGLSWATGVWYENLDAKRSYKQSPAVGGGIDFTIRPWVRVGAEYLWSRYRREQHYSQLTTDVSSRAELTNNVTPMKAYGNYLMNYHNASLGVQFNFMELWPKRNAQWFNIWLGTGFGYSFAKGNEYGIYVTSTKTQNGVTTPFVNGEVISNESTVTVSGYVQTTNRHEKFNKPYIPATLHIEADVSRQFTVGLKGEMDWLLKREDLAAKNLIFALATVRYNFVPSRAKVQRDYYEGEISTLNDRVNALRREAADAKAQADREAAARRAAEEQNSDLQRRLKDCEESKKAPAKAELPTHYVQFSNNSSHISREELSRLRSFAKDMQGRTLSLVAEASRPGTEEYNQQLSERRLTNVVDALVKEGFSSDDLHPSIAIGKKNDKPGAEGRRVTIKVEDNK